MNNGTAGAPAPQLNPQPTPQTWAVDRITGPDGANYVRVQVSGFSGLFVAFIPAELAQGVVDMITHAATGLRVARTPFTTPN